VQLKSCVRRYLDWRGMLVVPSIVRDSARCSDASCNDVGVSNLWGGGVFQQLKFRCFDTVSGNLWEVPWKAPTQPLEG
jgi:hypothetical protein